MTTRPSHSFIFTRLQKTSRSNFLSKQSCTSAFLQAVGTWWRSVCVVMFVMYSVYEALHTPSPGSRAPPQARECVRSFIGVNTFHGLFLNVHKRT